jgi:hypothetical protein
MVGGKPEKKGLFVGPRQRYRIILNWVLNEVRE